MAAKPIITEGDLATCNHVITSRTPQSNLFFNGRRVARINIDTAGTTAGVILGSHNKRIFINGRRVSVKDDLIADHGKDEHDEGVAFTDTNNTGGIAG